MDEKHSSEALNIITLKYISNLVMAYFLSRSGYI